MRINILSFGSLNEVVAGGPIDVAEITDSDSLKTYLLANYPEIADKKFVIAINKNIIQYNTVLNELDTIAILPPFSGG
ncbi:MAG: molybdopterin synthase sulfur carrier subunit [Flavobacterium sp.]|nr:MAG: molybdopterin synthase sulfur carrier subunit [Flavobacterium sp.]